MQQAHREDDENNYVVELQQLKQQLGCVSSIAVNPNVNTIPLRIIFLKLQVEKIVQAKVLINNYGSLEPAPLDH